MQQDLNTRRRWRRREEEPGRPCDERRGGEDGAVRGDAEFHFAQTAKLRRAGREGVVQQGLGFPAAAGAAAAEVQNRWAVEEGDDVPNRTGIARGKWVVVRIMIGGFFFFFLRENDLYYMTCRCGRLPNSGAHNCSDREVSG